MCDRRRILQLSSDLRRTCDHMLQILQNKIKEPDEKQMEQLRIEFAETCCVYLPGFVGTPILRQLIKKLETTVLLPKFESEGDDKFGQVLFVPTTQPIIFMFHLVMNNPSLFSLVETITDCPPIGNFRGRMHRSLPAKDHSIDWHGDNADGRLLGVTINLSAGKYLGGTFLLRNKHSGKILRKISDTNAGDAFIFSISPDLQHRLMPLSDSGGDRTVGVGWFRSSPDWQTFAKHYFRPTVNNS